MGSVGEATSKAVRILIPTDEEAVSLRRKLAGGLWEYTVSIRSAEQLPEDVRDIYQRIMDDLDAAEAGGEGKLHNYLAKLDGMALHELAIDVLDIHEAVVRAGID